VDVKFVVVLSMVVVCAACASSPSTTTAQTFVVGGYVHAGLMCPVVHEPPDPNCADRPVADAVMAVRGADGIEVVRVSTDQEGRFTLTLPAGTYTLIPQPVTGLVGTAPEQSFVVPGFVELDVAYDTGIR